MPFGKRLLSLAVEGEFKQSCVIFSFYFMSVVATKLDVSKSFARTEFVFIFNRLLNSLLLEEWHIQLSGSKSVIYD